MNRTVVQVYNRMVTDEDRDDVEFFPLAARDDGPWQESSLGCYAWDLVEKCGMANGVRAGTVFRITIERGELAPW